MRRFVAITAASLPLFACSPTEAADDGGDGDGEPAPVCGDGVIGPFELCDDGNQIWRTAAWR